MKIVLITPDKMVYVRFESRFKQLTLVRMQRIAELEGISLAEALREAAEEYVMKKDI